MKTIKLIRVYLKCCTIGELILGDKENPIRPNEKHTLRTIEPTRDKCIQEGAYKIIKSDKNKYRIIPNEFSLGEQSFFIQPGEIPVDKNIIIGMYGYVKGFNKNAVMLGEDAIKYMNKILKEHKEITLIIEEYKDKFAHLRVE